MSDKWGQMSPVRNEGSGRYFTAKSGPYKGQVGEEVYRLSWGGINLQFADGQIVTFAMSDVDESFMISSSGSYV